MQQTNAALGNGQPAALPIFYQRPWPLDAAGDRGLSLQPVLDFGFARATNSVLLGAAEYPRAMPTTRSSLPAGSRASR
jgi:hypothetical protein